jgi:hypothetical protein
MRLTIFVALFLRGTSMICQPLPTTTPFALPPVWSALPGDLQQRAVRLLAQLAYAHLRQQTSLTIQESYHDHSPQQSQDSPRPS